MASSVRFVWAWALMGLSLVAMCTPAPADEYEAWGTMGRIDEIVPIPDTTCFRYTNYTQMGQGPYVHKYDLLDGFVEFTVDPTPNKDVDPADKFWVSDFAPHLVVDPWEATVDEHDSIEICVMRYQGG